MSVTARLSKISLEDGGVNKVISNMGTQSLTMLYQADNRNADVSEMKPAEFKKYVGEAVHQASVKYFVEQLSLEQLEEAVAPLKIDHKNNNPHSKKVLAKRLREHLETSAIGSYLEEHASADLLKSYAESVEVVPSKDTKDTIRAIVEESERTGLELFLQSFPDDVIRDISFQMKLETDPLAIHSKSVLIECIMENKDAPEKSGKKKEKIVFSKSKKAIASGLTYQDIFQHYSVEELIEWCHDNEVKSSGSKKEIINRILLWLAGDKENTKAGVRRISKRRKSVGGAKKVTKKAAPEATEEAAAPKTTKKTPAPAPAPVEPEVEEEGEEEEGEDGLDLDNLEKYELEELKTYCEEEEIKVKGKKKQDYMAAILAYNEDQEE